MSQRRSLAIRPAPAVVTKSLGLGGVIQRASRAVGIPHCSGCERRAARLDRWVSLTRLAPTVATTGNPPAERSSAVSGVFLVLSAAWGVAVGAWLGATLGERTRQRRQRRAESKNLVHAQEYERSNVTVAAAILGALAGGTTAALLAIKKNIRETMNLTVLRT
jgi:hypothetical protein